MHVERVPTLYVRNLNDKVKIEGKSSVENTHHMSLCVSEMRVNLFMLFSTYGEVVQVRMRATNQLRGQAFVVFRELISAERALTDL